MKNQEKIDSAEILRLLPSVDALLRSQTAQDILPETGAKRLAATAREAVNILRQKIQKQIFENKAFETNLARKHFLFEAEKMLAAICLSEKKSSLQKVINATGVVIHTNLGRAPMSEAARRAVFEIASGYCNLEYNLETGKRGQRGERAEKLLAEITDAEAALIVNNCAAACVLVLTALAKGGEAIISRGELVEIGGDFRIPDVMHESGAFLREVGSTNRTKISDYEKAINENTRLIARVHPSNYRIVGFTEKPELPALAELAHKNGILLYEDAGSGALFDLREYGLTDEPVISQSIAAGADVVTFSGDKLLGGSQAGLIVGRLETIEILRKHPLYRALRAGKLIYAALEATLLSFRREKASEEIPVLKMLSADEKAIKKRVEDFAEKLAEKLGADSNLKFETSKGNSVIGGGSAPAVEPQTWLLILTHEKFSANELEQFLRQSNPPIIARILENKVALDLRTVFENEEAKLLSVIEEAVKEN